MNESAFGMRCGLFFAVPVILFNLHYFPRYFPANGAPDYAALQKPVAYIIAALCYIAACALAGRFMHCTPGRAANRPPFAAYLRRGVRLMLGTLGIWAIFTALVWTCIDIALHVDFAKQYAGLPPPDGHATYIITLGLVLAGAIFFSLPSVILGLCVGCVRYSFDSRSGKRRSPEPDGGA